jgi:hypothetical protein
MLVLSVFALVFLVEWLELLTSLGANKVFLYNLEVHPNVTKVINFKLPFTKVNNFMQSIVVMSQESKCIFIYFQYLDL